MADEFVFMNPKTTSPGAVRTLRILVVDDNHDASRCLAMLLRIAGNEILTVDSGAEAVTVAQTFRPHVALLDIGMPGMNGYELARAIRSQPWGKEMTLIAVTGWDHEDQLSSEAGFDYHLVKPVDATSLAQLLSALSSGW